MNEIELLLGKRPQAKGSVTEEEVGDHASPAQPPSDLEVREEPGQCITKGIKLGSDSDCPEESGVAGWGCRRQ